MTTPRIRNVDRKPWRPGAWITEGGDVVFVPSEQANQAAMATINGTPVVIARAMAAADHTINSKKDQS